ncbi:MAG: DUF4388 domain-containing protein [Polyangiaceae bacterium]|nr:DUF4388 domain-containing protein [Polyangiaceae bacterium]MCL4751915.1 DUF4388 domain-containing protein [Myxococcales bacterium]
MWTPTWVGERLRAEGLITAAQLSATVQAMQLYNERMEEALLRIGAIDEDRLLRFAAERCRTQFVSTAKLARLQVTDQALRLLPERVADKLLAFPVRYEPDTDTLSIVSPDAGDPEYKKQLSIAIRVREVKPYIARPAAVKAAIAKWYRGETNPFASLLSDSFMLGNAFEPEPRRPTDTRPGPAAPQHAPVPAPPAPVHPRGEYFVTPVPTAAAPRETAVPRDVPPPPPMLELTAPQAPEAFRAPAPRPAPQPRAPTGAPQPPAFGTPHPPTFGTPQRAAFGTTPQPEPSAPQQPHFGSLQEPFGAHEPAEPSHHVVPVPDAPPARESYKPPAVPHPSGKSGTAAPAPRFVPSGFPGPVSEVRDKRLRDLAELLNVLVTLNENSRDEFRGHSASVARLSKMMTERMGLDEVAQMNATIAANLHDLGKPISYHLTPLNVAQYDTHRRAALKLVYTPQRLVESVGLPMEATTAVSSMYERFDGSGFPGRMAGKSIPLSARVLALCDTYSDLTLNPRNLYRKELSHEEAHKVLDEYAGSLFDPDLVELLSQLVVGEDLRRRLSDDKPLVLIVEPDPEEATILELRLVAQGFDVKVTRAADQALKFAEAGNLRYVLSEVELQPFDGFDLLQRLRRSESTKNVPFLFVAKNSDAAAVDRAFSLGAQDYVVKPTTGDVLAGKLRRLAAAPRKNSSDNVAAGVAGSLKDLALPDLMQILFHGRKSGKVSVKSSGREGQLHFQEGRMVHALLDELAGEEAVYEMLTFDQGSFALDPSFQPTTTTIQASPEMVILEGLRRLDEKNRGA